MVNIIRWANYPLTLWKHRKKEFNENLLIFVNFSLRVGFFMPKTLSFDASPIILLFTEQSCNAKLVQALPSVSGLFKESISPESVGSILQAIADDHSMEMILPLVDCSPYLTIFGMITREGTHIVSHKKSVACQLELTAPTLLVFGIFL